MMINAWTRKEMIRVLSLSAAALFSRSLAARSYNYQSPIFSQQPLPYAFAALDPYIDALTMEIHYTKHAAAYCNNLNLALEKVSVPTDLNLEKLLNNISAYPDAVRNNGGGHYNHELFWTCMTPKGNTLKENHLKQSIDGTFGSFNKFQEIFSEAAKTRFGSGWAWFYLDANKELKIGSTPNQDNPLMDISPVRGYPLLCLDVWEHAYYLKYQNRRMDYIQQWWNIVDWDFISERFNRALS
jgi:Fe-Mn family superoxide dismutase